MNAEDPITFASPPGFPEYEVSSDGLVVRRRFQRNGEPVGRTMSLYLTREGYMRVSTVRGPAFVHRLVCLAFHGLPPKDKTLAVHMNGMPRDNRASNLRWGTVVRNVKRWRAWNER